MNLGYYRLSPAVTVGINRKDLTLAVQKNVINAPGIDRKAFNFWILTKSLFNSQKNVTKKCFYIPNQVTVFSLHTVRKTKDLFCLNFAIIPPADNMSAA